MSSSSNISTTISLEVSTLSESNYTGIANVTKNLAIELLNDSSVDGRFFMFRNELPKKIIEKLVIMDEGELLWWISGRLHHFPGFSSFENSQIIGVYPWQKRNRCLFPFEVQIVHDLTPVILPECHTNQTVAEFTKYILADMLSSDLLVAISQSTLSDIRTYFPQVNHIPAIFSHLGSSFTQPISIPKDTKIDKYILTIGTIEPRKNVKQVLKCLSEFPFLMDNFNFVFVGRWGWGSSIEEMINELNLQNYLSAGKIIFTGFVSNQVCSVLLEFSHGIIYPTLYEGFGLPVIEAFEYGKPIITSSNSSISEIADEHVIYADVDSLISLRDRILDMQMLNEDDIVKNGKIKKEFVRKFNWSATYGRIKDAAIELYQKKNTN